MLFSQPMNYPGDVFMACESLCQCLITTSEHTRAFANTNRLIWLIKNVLYAWKLIVFIIYSKAIPKVPSTFVVLTFIMPRYRRYYNLYITDWASLIGAENTGRLSLTLPNQASLIYRLPCWRAIKYELYGGRLLIDQLKPASDDRCLFGMSLSRHRRRPLNTQWCTLFQRRPGPNSFTCIHKSL